LRLDFFSSSFVSIGTLSSQGLRSSSRHFLAHNDKTRTTRSIEIFTVLLLTPFFTLPPSSFFVASLSLMNGTRAWSSMWVTLAQLA
jgi:hypothetical protein